jgi:hypothetical protein
MRVLERAQRPVVTFDPADAEHRRLYLTFLKTSRWSHSPVRFHCNQNYLELPYYLNQVLVEYYMEQDGLRQVDSLAA